MTDIGKRIKHMRKTQSMTWLDVCEKAEIAYETLANISSGKHKPTNRTLDKLADALGCTPEYLKYGGAEYDNLKEGVRKELAKNVWTLRKKHKMTRQELADATEMSYGTLYIIETAAREVKTEQIVKLARFFKVSVNQLIGK